MDEKNVFCKIKSGEGQEWGRAGVGKGEWGRASGEGRVGKGEWGRGRGSGGGRVAQFQRLSASNLCFPMPFCISPSPLLPFPTPALPHSCPSPLQKGNIVNNCHSLFFYSTIDVSSVFFHAAFSSRASHQSCCPVRRKSYAGTRAD